MSKHHFVYIMNICKYERTFLMKENAHKISQGSFTYSKALIAYEPWYVHAPPVVHINHLQYIMWWIEPENVVLQAS